MSGYAQLLTLRPTLRTKQSRFIKMIRLIQKTFVLNVNLVRLEKWVNFNGSSVRVDVWTS